MSLKDYKITDDAVQNVYVQSQPDILNGTTQENKAAFDAYPALIKDRFNAVLEILGGDSAASEMLIQAIEGLTAENVQQALAELKSLLDAYIEKIKSTAGAAEVGVSAISGMTAQNAQAALSELKALIDDLVVGALPPGSVTANMIEDGAIVQLGALLAVAAAAAYNPSGTYVIGDYCTNDGNLYKCNTPIESGEAWTAEHWTETTVAAELAEVRASLSNKLDKISALFSGTDLNTVLVSGNYRLAGNGNEFTNTPPADVSWCLLHVVGDSDTVSQTLYMLGGDRWGRMLRSGTIWSDWRRISTATLPQEYDIPFQSGWQANGTKATYCKSQEGICIVNCSVYGTGLASNNFIASLPEGVRPSANFGCSAHAYKGGVRGIAEAQITYNGDIVIYSPIEFDYVSFSCAFVARN